MDQRPPIPRVTDTSDEATAVQLRLLRAMTPSRKVSLVEDANATARRLALAGIELRFPHASAAQRFRLLMDLVLGEELAAKAFGPPAGASGR